MISEFHQLSDKISQLAELAQALRRENASLRLNAAALTAENADLFKRMQQAHARVLALLEKMPAVEQSEDVV